MILSQITFMRCLFFRIHIFTNLTIMYKPNNKCRRAIRVFLFSLLTVAAYVQNVSAQTSPPSYRTYEFTNGKWFNGQQFVEKMFYSVNGVLTKKKPAKIDETIDLKGGFVIPPFADAHCHHFDAPYNVKQQVEMYLRDGIFYAKVQSNLRTGALK